MKPDSMKGYEVYSLARGENYADIRDFPWLTFLLAFSAFDTMRWIYVCTTVAALDFLQEKRARERLNEFMGNAFILHTNSI
jgi:hypothetical protein